MKGSLNETPLPLTRIYSVVFHILIIMLIIQVGNLCEFTNSFIKEGETSCISKENIEAP